MFEILTLICGTILGAVVLTTFDIVPLDIGIAISLGANLMSLALVRRFRRKGKEWTPTHAKAFTAFLEGVEHEGVLMPNGIAYLEKKGTHEPIFIVATDEQAQSLLNNEGEKVDLGGGLWLSPFLARMRLLRGHNTLGEEEEVHTDEQLGQDDKGT